MVILFLVNGPRSLPRNPPNCIILDNQVFDNLISVDDLLAKTLRRFSTCLLVNNNLWGELLSSSPTIFNDNLKTTPVSIRIRSREVSSWFTFLKTKNIYTIFR